MHKGMVLRLLLELILVSFEEISSLLCIHRKYKRGKQISETSISIVA